MWWSEREKKHKKWYCMWESTPMGAEIPYTLLPTVDLCLANIWSSKKRIMHCKRFVIMPFSPYLIGFSQLIEGWEHVTLFKQLQTLCNSIILQTHSSGFWLSSLNLNFIICWFYVGNIFEFCKARLFQELLSFDKLCFPIKLIIILFHMVDISLIYL